MPVHSGQDKHGKYYQWGKSGKKYYHNGSNASKARARSKAGAQGRAVRASGWSQ